MSNHSLRFLFLPKARFQIIFSIIISLIAVAITWSLSAYNSPLYEYGLWHVWLPNLWGMLNFIPAIFGLLVSGSVHAPSEPAIMIGIIIQWFILGFMLSNLIAHLYGIVRRT
jgi:hypothetical protein